MVELTLLETGLLHSIFGGIDDLLNDINENRRADMNYATYLIDWNEYAEYIDVLESLEDKGCLRIGKDGYFFIGECEYNCIVEGLEAR